MSGISSISSGFSKNLFPSRQEGLYKRDFDVPLMARLIQDLSLREHWFNSAFLLPSGCPCLYITLKRVTLFIGTARK
jgi:hypothetical protein